MRGFVRRVLFARLFLTLGCMLGVMQVVVGHWVTVVLAGREGPGLGFGLLLASLLVAANAFVVPAIRHARNRGGGWRLLARLYVTTGLATILLGLPVLLSWLGLFSLGGLLALLGVDPQLIFSVFRVMSLFVVLALGAMVVWGFTGGQARIEHTQVRIPAPDGGSLRGLRIAHVSDLHIGNGMEDERLESLVARVNSVGADLIAITGDIFDFDPQFVEAGARALAHLEAPLGVYAVLGNHDTYTGTDLVVDALERHAPQICLLRGQVERAPGDTLFYLAGIDDPGRDWTAQGLDLPALDALAEQRPGDGPVLLLVHRPEAFPQAARLGFPVVLAGHTHGGQLALPTPGGSWNLARLITQFHRGLFELDGSSLYVNRGVGIAGPAIRFNCTREIATIELI